MTSRTPAAPRRATDARSGPLSRRFLDGLRSGEASDIDRVIESALDAGLEPAAVQSLVIQPAMVRIGELWETGHITVADEHLASSLSERSLIRLFEELSANRARGICRGRVVLAAVQGQQHVLGLRMIADVLEGAGFAVYYLGADVPAAACGPSSTSTVPMWSGSAC